jgi:hypothetical protein
MNMIKLSFLIFAIIFCANFGFSQSITLKTDDPDECIGIGSFLSNNKGEIFLFSRRTHKIFKFKKTGDFEKAFCRYGIGPGEIKRVLFMFHNPANDFLYFPEYYSGLGRVSVFDSDGNFKDYLDIEIPPQKKDHIFKLIFLEDGSFYAIFSERVGWESRGKVYVTKDKISVLYFDKNGKQKAAIYTTFQNDEVAHAPRYGGPRVLFLPDILVKKVPEGNICIGKTDENVLHFYSKTGVHMGTTQLEMKRLLLSDSEFENAKSKLIKAFKEGSRMQWLAKRMIKLKYKPIYDNFFVLPSYYVTFEFIKENVIGYPKETVLTFFNKNGEPVSIKKVKGFVMNITNNQLFIKEYDEEENESFRVEELNMK